MSPEQSLCEAIADLLGLPSVDPHDDFFVMGGHSLLAAQLARRVSAEYGVRVPLRAIYQNPTAAALAGHVGTH